MSAHDAYPPHHTNGNSQPYYSDESSNSPTGEKEKNEELETIHTNERVGSHTNYYEKGGLRTEGDGQDHVGAHHRVRPLWPPQLLILTSFLQLGFKGWMAIVAMCFLWTASQIPVYLFGGVVPEIYGDIGGVDRWIWMIIGNLIALAAICPFTGALSDLIGRRYVALIGTVLIIIGMVVSSTAKVMNNMIGKPRSLSRLLDTTSSLTR